MKDEINIYSKLYLETFHELNTCMMNLKVELEPIFAKIGQEYPKKFSGYDLNDDTYKNDCIGWGYELVYQLKWLEVFYRNNNNYRMYQHCHYAKPSVDLFKSFEYEVKNPEYRGGIGGGDKEFLLLMLKTYRDDNSYPKVFVNILPEILRDIRKYSDTLSF